MRCMRALLELFKTDYCLAEVHTEGTKLKSRKETGTGVCGRHLDLQENDQALPPCKDPHGPCQAELPHLTIDASAMACRGQR